MAGTLFSLALSQRFDRDGGLEIDAPLYIYDANTSTPVNVFQDFGLSVLHPWPMRTDSAGMIPPFWLADGQYRARFTDDAGAVVYFDIPSIQAVGPSAGGGGGGGGEAVDANAIFQTGDILWQPKAGPRAGWVRANARTIGSASSGATERANADTQPLFEYLWNNFSNTLCPVTGGRGASAAADFAANKPIATLNMRGRGPIGLDDMGNSAEGVLEDGTPTVAGSGGGTEKFTIARNQLPNLKLGGTTNPGGAHDHATDFTNASSGLGTGPSPVTRPGSNRTGDAPNHTHVFETESMNGNVTQQKVNNMSPYRLGSWYLRLSIAIGLLPVLLNGGGYA